MAHPFPHLFSVSKFSFVNYPVFCTLSNWIVYCQDLHVFYNLDTSLFLCVCVLCDFQLFLRGCSLPFHLFLGSFASKLYILMKPRSLLFSFWLMLLMSSISTQSSPAS